jgi:steroid 5-alpha reductase family enzyme
MRLDPFGAFSAFDALVAPWLAPGLLQNFVLTALLILACQLALWLLSIRLRDASIVDIFWGPAFALVAVATWLHVQGTGVASRQALIVALTCLWAIRLGVYIGLRSRGHGEDPRYTAFRKHAKGNENLFILRNVFIAQGRSMWLTSLPVQVGQFLLAPAAIGPVAWLGVAVWTVGFLFETVGDWQLARFRRDPANAGRIMQTGLWRYTRHPNYFGDACVWWGLFLIACDHWIGLFTIIAPWRMTNALVNRTGKKLLEKKMRKTRPDYEDYIARTSGFLPWPPRKPPAPGADGR